MAPAGHRRRPADRRGLALPGPPSTRASRVGGERVGRFGEQSPGEILSDHHRRASAVSCCVVFVVDLLAGGLESPDDDDRIGMTGPSWRRYLRFWGSDLTADVDDELRFHIESRVQEYVDAGLAPDDARAEAVRRFGNVAAVQRSCQEIDQLTDQERRRADMWDALRQ